MNEKDIFYLSLLLGEFGITWLHITVGSLKLIYYKYKSMNLKTILNNMTLF
jgi:hypothetical protein